MTAINVIKNSKELFGSERVNQMEYLVGMKCYVPAEEEKLFMDLCCVTFGEQFGDYGTGYKMMGIPSYKDDSIRCLKELQLMSLGNTYFSIFLNMMINYIKTI